MPGRQGPGDQAQQRGPAQGARGGHQQQQKDAAQATSRRPQNIRGVKARDLVGEAGEAQANGGGGAEEGQDEQGIDEAQSRQLPGIPEDFQGVETDPLGGEEGQQRRQAEETGGGSKDPREALPQTLLRQGDDGPCRPIAQQGHADHHVGEVVPLDDGEEPHQQDLVAQDRG